MMWNGRSAVNLPYSGSMPKRKAVHPAEVAGEGVDWISADLSHNISAEYARLFAKGLRDEIDRQDITVRGLGALAGVSHSTIKAIIDGVTVPDLGTVALLEKALKKELLPARRLIR